MANEKRFIFDSVANWNALAVEDQKLYNESIVFLTDGTNESKGVKIITHGAEFEMSNESDIKTIIEDYLAGKSNIVVKTEEVEVDGKKETKLVISETSIDSLTGKKESTELVQAKAVAGALTTPVSLTLAVKDNVGTFSETFTTLNGDTTEAVTAVFESGSNIELTQGEKGLVITAKDTTYNAGTGISIAQAIDDETKQPIADTFVINHSNTVTAKTTEGGETVTLSATDKDFKLDQFKYDAQGHITGSVERTVTLPDSAFETYAVSAAADGSNVKVNLDKTLGATTTTDSISLAGAGDVTVSVAGNAGAEVITIKDVPYVGKEAIAVSATANEAGNKEVSLTIDSTDKFLSQSASGLKANIEVAYDSATNFIYLKGVGTDDKTTGFDASAFVKDSFLKSAELVNSDGKNEGKFLKLTFHTVDTDKNPDTATEEIVYVDVKDLFSEISGDTATFSVVEFEAGAYTVKNTLGTISRDNDKNTITVSKAGLATVSDIKTVLETIDSDLDAVKADGADANEIAVVTGVTQVDGKITAVDSGLAATKTYVDNKVSGAEGEIQLTSTKGAYSFAAVKDKDGYVKASQLAEVLNDAWAWGTLTQATQA